MIYAFNEGSNKVVLLIHVTMELSLGHLLIVLFYIMNLGYQ